MGGVIAKAAGEKKYDGSGTDFTATAYGQKNIHTALIQGHTINDLMFGYPSAYLGWVGFRAQMAQAAKALDTSLSTTELAKRMLTGRSDANLSFKLGNVADYTSKVGSVCYATCLKNGNCVGYAPGRHETSDVDKVKLGGIECKPYTPAYEAIAKCKAASAARCSIPALLEWRHVFAPMAVTSGIAKDAVLLPVSTMEAISGVKAVCLR